MAHSLVSRRGAATSELLLGLGVVLLLLLIAFAMLNPLRELAEARDAQRRSDVRVILNALHAWREAHGGEIPEGITTTPAEICVTNAASCVHGVNLNFLTGSVLPRIPVDPLATGTGTDYTVARDAFRRLIVSAPGAERELTISVSR